MAGILAALAAIWESISGLFKSNAATANVRDLINEIVQIIQQTP